MSTIKELTMKARRKNEPQEYEEDNLTSYSQGKEGERMSEPNLIDLTNDDELMDRVLRKSAEMQNELLEQAEEMEEE